MSQIQYKNQTRKLSNNLHEQDSFLILIEKKKRVNCNIFGKKWRIEYVLLIYFEQIVSCFFFVANFYSSATSIQLIWE